MKFKCSKCLLEKEKDNFYWKSDGIIRNHICKDCWRTIRKSNYTDNREYYLNKSKKHGAENRCKYREFLLEYFKDNHCVDCGESDPLVLDFDHLSDKKMNVSAMKNYKLDAIKKEISKCVVRCGNCHRRKTAVSENSWRLKLRVDYGTDNDGLSFQPKDSKCN
jgi:hypothetical protein